MKSTGQSITDKLISLSQKSDVGFANLKTQFLIERLVFRISKSQELSSKLIYKGGYVCLRIYNSPRFTTDIDALSKVPLIEINKEIQKTVENQNLSDGVWFKFIKTQTLRTQGSEEGLRLSFRAGIGEVLKDLSKCQILNLDLSFGDSVVPQEVLTNTNSLIFDEEISWKIYPPESIVSEKLHALISRGSLSSRSKDIFDINFLIEKCDFKNLEKATISTFTASGDTTPNDIVEELKSLDTTRLKKGWKSATQSIGSFDFDEVFNDMIQKYLQLSENN